MKPLICNLKNHGTLKEMLAYKRKMEEEEYPEIILCPNHIFLTLMHSKKYSLCAQDFSEKENHTGGVSLESLKSIGVKKTLIGHAETNTTYEQKIRKIKQALQQEMECYIILSDSKKDYDYQYTSTKLLGQIRGILSQILEKQYSKITFIYEPSWLINTSVPANLKDIENIFYFMKEELKQEYNTTFAFFYGGGLTKNNLKDYYESPYIDGILLGNLSFDPQNVITFLQNRQN